MPRVHKNASYLNFMTMNDLLHSLGPSVAEYEFYITLFGPNFRRFSGPNLSLALFVYRLIGAILKVFYDPFLKLK